MSVDAATIKKIEEGYAKLQVPYFPALCPHLPAPADSPALRGRKRFVQLFTTRAAVAAAVEKCERH